MIYKTIQTPIDTIVIRGDGDNITGLYMDAHKWGPSEFGEYDPENAILKRAEEQLNAYFAKELTMFDLPLKVEGTEFQQKVWMQLREIPYGETWNYGQLAKRVGNPDASRAVGAANGRNPISIIVPCHRVIGSNKKLVGFGGGLPRKQFLLALENPERSLPL